VLPEDATRELRGRPPRHTDVEVLDAALRAFAAHGYEGVSLRSLAADLGLSHGALGQRFGSKDDLFRAAVDHGFGGLFAEVGRQRAQQPTPADDLQDLWLQVNAFLHAVSARPDVVRLLAHEGVEPSPRFDVIAEHIVPNVGPAAGALARLTAAGTIRPITVRGLFVLVFLGAASAYTLSALSARFDDIDGPLDGPTHADTLTDVIISGLRRESITAG
jgi:AcrR family transcriptional regulator